MLTTLRLDLRPSGQLAFLLAALHLAAVASVSVLPVSSHIQLPFILIIAWAAIVSIRRNALLNTVKAFRSLVLLPDGGVEALRADGESLRAEVSPQSTLFPWLVVLLLKTPARRSPEIVLLLPDSLSVDEQRKLRSWLRLRAG